MPDLKLAISMADHQPWADAAKKWFVDGHHEEGDEMSGRIVFLGPDMKKELGEITLDARRLQEVLEGRRRKRTPRRSRASRSSSTSRR